MSTLIGIGVGSYTGGGGEPPFLSAPLTSDLALTAGTGTFSLTRATAASGKTTGNLIYFETSGNPVFWGNDGVLIQKANTNLLIRSRNFSTFWIATGTPALAADQIGVDGVANTAWSLQDNANTYESIANVTTITADTNIYTASAYVKKDANNTVFAGFFFRALTGGTDTYAYMHINTSTGAITISNAVGAGFDAYSIEDAGQFWRVQATLTNTNNTTLTVTLMPAISTVFGTLSANAQRTTVYDAVQLELGTYATSFISTTSWWRI